MEIAVGNVNQAFKEMVDFFDSSAPTIVRTTSRVGDVLQIVGPVTITYLHPWNRVLFNSYRDCNPFFHLYEALWMLAGRDDIAGPAYYAANYRECVQDGNSPKANGAYGHRWRHPVDQLLLIADQLRRKPDCRRCVLQIWNVEDDLLRINTSKDLSCNTHVYFLLRNNYLDMTVCNRSNDLIWGALGANVVHFSMLQEYLAARISCWMGVYNHFTNNMHVYVDRFKPKLWKKDKMYNLYNTDPPFPSHHFPLVCNPDTFDVECARFVERHSVAVRDDIRWSEPFLRDVARWMCLAFHWHKVREYEAAMYCIERVEALDWQEAGRRWLLKRKEKYEAGIDES